MDTGSDFVRSEFLNVLFFEQKNLVIFPYIDMKHLHSLEIFCAGFNIVDLESTALHNLKEILEFETNNSYSQNPSLFLIYNLDRIRIQEITTLSNIRCILNTNENVSDLANCDNFIYFNKKTQKFLNYEVKEEDLELENYLFSISDNETALLEHVQKLKIVATRIFVELNENGHLNALSDILSEYDQKYWYKILKFVKLYFKIEVPEIADLKKKLSQRSANTKNNDLHFSEEYEYIVSLNKNITKEFLQLLHSYRSERVNPSNLELDQLFNPQKLYEYLRIHHWQNGVPEDFLTRWIQMSSTGYRLLDEDLNDFETILKKLGSSENFLLDRLNKTFSTLKNDQYDETGDSINIVSQNLLEKVPLIENFDEFKRWLLRKIDAIEKVLK